MRHVSYDRVVPIPTTSGITINRGDKNRVLFVVKRQYNSKKGYDDHIERVTIGYAINDSEMHPNENYKNLFPNLWENATGEKTIPLYKYIGLFSAILGISDCYNIKAMINNSFCEKVSDFILDYTNYLISLRCNSVIGFQDYMTDQMCFSDRIKSDSYYSDLFKNFFNLNNIHKFKREWLLYCKQEFKIEDTWLVLDGSNIDCKSKGVELSEKGYSKSKNNSNVISFSYTITEDGLPVTYDLFRGQLVDSKSIKNTIDFLNEFDVNVKGVIIDRGFCTKDCLDYLKDKKINYEVMLKKNTCGFTEMVEKYGDEVKFNVDYLVENTSLFAIQDECKLFKNSDDKDVVTLFYDTVNAASRIDSLLKGIYEEKDRIEKLINSGMSYAINQKYIKYINIDENKNIVLNKEALKKDLKTKGLYTIANNERYLPSVIYNRYKKRQGGEKQYSIIKTQLGFYTARIHDTPALYAKFFIAFIATIFRYFIACASDKCKKDTNTVIRELNKIYMSRFNKRFLHSSSETDFQKEIFQSLDLDISILDTVAQLENDRLDGKLPKIKYRKHINQQSDNSSNNVNEGQKKRGVPKGTKRGMYNKDGSLRKKPGPSTKDKSEDSNLSQIEQNSSITHIKKRGVPKGTKRGEYNKDGSLRKRPGPKPKIKHDSNVDNNINTNNN